MTVPSLFATARRTHLCGELRAGHAGETVRLGGWVHRNRSLGSIVFLDLRDRAGLLQATCDPRFSPPEVIALAGRLGAETVVEVEGVVAARPVEMVNRDLETGTIELQVTALRVVGPAATPAIPVARGKDEKLAAEELRLKHRILDLRRPELQANLILRHRLLQVARHALASHGFLEIETPILTKTTPEGARDYLVPSRVHPGEFYALPQSPQIYKQLLMVAGFDRYFQIARCFRDEDLRADRQPEFTQIDIECAFVTQEDVQATIERVLVALWAEAGHAVATPFPRLSWHEAMERFGIDKPDMRFGLELEDWTAQVQGDAAAFVQDGLATGGTLRGIRVPGGAALSRKEVDALAAIAKANGLGGLLWAKRTDAGWEGQGTKAFGTATLEAIGGTVGDLLVAGVGANAAVLPALGQVRLELTRRPGQAPTTAHAFCWIVDFPLFELDAATGEHTPSHHPFTAPHPDDTGKLESAPWECRAMHYDAVYNGNELGSGSIRITDPVVQETIFRLLKVPKDEIQRRFGFLLDGLGAGAPPHGGFALGFDRIAMLLAGSTSLRDVIAFPKTTAARALFEGAPSPVSERDLSALNIAVQIKEPS
ncbi:MAG: aspartate--tRNA ligase [Gemmatimonadaceae bacterium]|nr:aspartate--tRNA ligase [Gemmatimonadaceae bacterium]